MKPSARNAHPPHLRPKPANEPQKAGAGEHEGAAKQVSKKLGEMKCETAVFLHHTAKGHLGPLGPLSVLTTTNSSCEERERAYNPKSGDFPLFFTAAFSPLLTRRTIRCLP